MLTKNRLLVFYINALFINFELILFFIVWWCQVQAASRYDKMGFMCACVMFSVRCSNVS